MHTDKRDSVSKSCDPRKTKSSFMRQQCHALIQISKRVSFPDSALSRDKACFFLLIPLSFIVIFNETSAALSLPPCHACKSPPFHARLRRSNWARRGRRLESPIDPR